MADRRFLLPLVLVVAALSSATIHPANAAGLLYVNPPQQGPFASGTTVTYQVKVANIDPFSGWDIQVKTDPTELSINATSFTITPNLLVANFSGSGFELIHCVNGAGAGCTLTDGPGIVHSAFQLLSLPPQIGPSSGLLFTITYTAGSNPSSFVNILSETISNGTPTPVAVTVQDGQYGLPPDFSITASPTALKIRQGSNGTSIVSLVSINSLSGTVTLSATSNVTAPNRPAQLSPGSVTLTSGGTGVSILTVFASATSTPIGIYSVNVTATSGAISHVVRFSINVTRSNIQDFGISAGTTTPASFTAGGSATSTMTLTNANSFAGKVNLATSTTTPVTGLTATFSVNPVTLTGPTANSVLTITTTASTPAGTYIITVTGTNSSASDGTLSHSANVTLTVTADFTITAGAATPASVPAGTSATSAITLNSLGFAGSIALAATVSPVMTNGPTTSFSVNSAVLTTGGTGTSVLTIATTSSTPVGTYTITVTGTGTGVPSHSATVTVAVINAPNLAVTSVSISNCSTSTCSATIGQTVTFTVAVANTGTVDENFTILIRWVGNITVAQLKVTTPLGHGQSQSYPITWDTTLAGEGSATIYAVVQPVPNEVNTADNTLTGPTLTLVAPSKPLLTSTQALIVGGGVGGVVVLLALFLLLRRRKAPTVQ